MFNKLYIKLYNYITILYIVYIFIFAYIIKAFMISKNSLKIQVCIMQHL